MTIRQEQWQLYFLGCFPSDLEQRKAVDGIWGPLSEEATRNFQKAFGIAETGEFDAATEQKSMETVDAIQDVVSRYAPVPLDQRFWGLAGTKTMDATRDYQHAMGLPETGIADAQTRCVILQQEGPEPQPELQEPDTGTFWDDIKWFTREEFRCKCKGKYCGGFPAEPKEQLVRIANQLRENLGVPVKVVSGLRCQRWNAIQKGVANSQHMYGEAVDIYAKGKTQAQVERELDRIGGVRYHYAISGSSNVHFDIPKGAR